MKIFFFLLVLVSIILLIFQPGSNQTNKILPITELHPEKIKILSSRVTCLKWGDLFGINLLQAKTELSQLLNHGDYLSELPAGESTVYWIYIPPLRTDREIGRQINRLHNLKVPYLHVQDRERSEWHNAISFGMFREQSAATQLMEELKKKGIANVNISKLNLEQVKFVVREPTEEVQEAIYRLALQFPDSRLERAECERF